MTFLKKLKEEKPWAVLGVSRRQYEIAKPWKKANMSKGKFEDILKMVPNEVIQDLKLYAMAELLTERMFESSNEN